ncbi:MAG TPA: Gfo/Idh/MocA family oxidoreductase [Candidatus Binatia bacterium]
MAEEPERRKLRVGVIGGGYGRNHILAYRVSDNVEVAAFCQRTQSDAEKIAREFHIPNVFTDYRDLLQLKDLDAVSIATPPNLHCTIALAAFARGLHVLCEKPLAMNGDEAQTMLAQAQAVKRTHMTAFNFRFIPAVTRAKELLEEGYVGKRIFHVDATWLVEGRLAAETPLGWRHRKETAGVGVLGDTGVHLIDLVRWLAGDFRRIAGQATIFHKQRRLPDGSGSAPVTVEDSCMFMAELAGGVQANIHVSGVARGNIFQSLRIFGSEGVLRVDIDRKHPDWMLGKLWGARGANANVEPLPLPNRLTRGLNFSDPRRAAAEFIFSNLTRRFARAIRTGEEATPSFREGMAAQKVIDAIVKSVEQEQWVSVASNN